MLSRAELFKRVFSAFDYTSRKDDAEWNAPHFTLYKPENSPYSMALRSEYEKAAKDSVD